ncbi:MAG: hypothetical protein A2033_17725 [Bacteroidetes bacterium GWA2_31_9]|nr:MAG: hypothetical protein A2033_17725 [Bacteroidetes bacterium GWA2_31_9]
MGQQDIISMIVNNDVKALQVFFSDVAGNEKQVSLETNDIDNLMNNNVWVDASDVTGLLNICEDEYLLKPDLKSFRLESINGNGKKKAIFRCTVFEQNGSLHELNIESTYVDLCKIAKNTGINEIDFFNVNFSNNMVTPIIKKINN